MEMVLYLSHEDSYYLDGSTSFIHFYQDSPEMLIIILIGCNTDKYTAVFTYQLLYGKLLKGTETIKYLAISL